jgi:hypothetical protein
MSLFLHRSGVMAGPRFVGLLDLYPDAAAAYSLRALRASWLASAVVRVRRSSDNAESDFTAAQITDGTLTTWTGANNGFVVTWYDQSGNTRNVTQSTAGNQPRIVGSGVLENDNGPTIRFLNASNTFLINGAALGAQPYTVFSVCTALQSNRFLLDSNSTNAMSFWRSNVGTDFRLYSSTAGITTIAGVLGAHELIYGLANGASSRIAIDGAAGTTGTIGTGSFNRIQVGGNVNRWDGYLSEMIIYNSDNSANRTGIEANINAHYGIY